MLRLSGTKPCTLASKTPTILPTGGMCASSMRVASLLTPRQAPLNRLRASRVRRSAPVSAVVSGAIVAEEEEGVSEKWWEKGTPNMRDINSIQEMVDVLADAGDHLVIVDFYAQWCGACRALYPKLCKMLAERPDVIFLKVNFDNNKQMAKSLGVKALPFFQFYRGAEGRVASFTCSVSKFQRFREALDAYEAPFCNIEEIPELEEFPDVHAHAQPSKV